MSELQLPKIVKGSPAQLLVFVYKHASHLRKPSVHDMWQHGAPDVFLLAIQQYVVGARRWKDKTESIEIGTSK